MRIYHNIPALYAYNALNSTNNALQKSIQTLSTGLRINSAADDAAGLAISEKMRSQINGLAMAMRNAQDGISMLQTAEGALTETHSMLQRMRELAVQAANDTLTQQDREFIQLEIDELKAGIDRVATTTQFNKKRLLDGSSAALWSTTDLSTKAYVRGSLRQTDQFGQKAAFEGNYRIAVNAAPGQAEVLKTDIFKIKHANVIMNKSVNQQAGAQDIRVDNLPAGNYTVEQGEMSGIGRAALIDASTGVSHIASLGFDVKNFSTEAATITVEVIAVDLDKKTVDLQVTDNLGHSKLIDDWDLTEQNIVLWGNTASGIGNNLTGGNTLDAVTVNLSTAGLAALDLEDFKVGEKLTYSVDAGTSVEELSSVSWIPPYVEMANPTAATQGQHFVGMTVTLQQGSTTVHKDMKFTITYLADADSVTSGAQAGVQVDSVEIWNDSLGQYDTVFPVAGSIAVLDSSSKGTINLANGMVLTMDLSDADGIKTTSFNPNDSDVVTVTNFQTNRDSSDLRYGKNLLDFVTVTSDDLTKEATFEIKSIAASGTKTRFIFNISCDNQSYGDFYYDWDGTTTSGFTPLPVTPGGSIPPVNFKMDFTKLVARMAATSKSVSDLYTPTPLTAKYKFTPSASAVGTQVSAIIPLPYSDIFSAVNATEESTVELTVTGRSATGVTFSVNYTPLVGAAKTGTLVMDKGTTSGVINGFKELGTVTYGLNSHDFDDYIVGDKLTYKVVPPTSGVVTAQTQQVGYYSGKGISRPIPIALSISRRPTTPKSTPAF